MSEPMLFRKKPVEVQAMQFTPENGAAVWEWADSKPMRGAGGAVIGLRIYTLHGDVKADFGDWVVRGPSGDFWPVTSSIFAETYEPVEKEQA